MEWGARGAQCDRTVGLSGDARDGRTHLGTGEVGGDHNGEGLESRAQKRVPLLRFHQSCVLDMSLWPERNGYEKGAGRACLHSPDGMCCLSRKHKEGRSGALRKDWPWRLTDGRRLRQEGATSMPPSGAVARVTEATIISEIAEVTSSLASPLAAAR